MIIYINTPGRNDKEEIKANLELLKKSVGPEAINLNQIAEAKKRDKDNKLYILSHGSPSAIGGKSPDELAKIVGEYINEKQPETKKIFLYACNTGNPINADSELTYAEEFADKLSNYLKTDDKIRILAPDGMIAFYENGEEMVLKDATPSESNLDLMEKIKKIKSTSDLEATKKTIQPFLAQNPFRFFNAIPLETIIKKQFNYHPFPGDNHARVVDMENRGPNQVLLSNAAYNNLTKFYARREQDADAVPVVSNNKNDLDDKKNLACYYAKGPK